MRIRDIDELAILEIEEKKSTIEISEIRDLLLKKTSDIIYFTVNKKLVGIVCLGDLLHRMVDKKIPIVYSFTRLEAFHDEVARNIFLSRTNIQKIPVVDCQGFLKGDYSRWDSNKTIFEWILKQNIIWKRLKRFLGDTGGYHKIYILEPIESKKEITNKLIEVFKENKIEFYLIKKIDIISLVEKSEKNCIVTVDEDEKRGVQCLEGYDFFKKNEKIAWYTIFEFFEDLNKYDKQQRENHYSIANEIGKEKNLFDNLQAKGVNIFSFYNNIYYTTDYIKNLIRNIRENMKRYNYQKGSFYEVDSFIGKKFFDNLLENEDYQNGKAQSQIIFGHQKHTANANYENDYYSIINGCRKTCYTPKEYKNKVLMLGQCMVMGAYNEDKYTVASLLQKKLVEAGYNYYVENHGSYENTFEVMQNIIFHPGDIVIIYTGENTYPGLVGIDLRKIYEENNIPSEWCLDSLNHFNYKVGEIIAETFYQKISEIIRKTYIDNVKEEIVFNIENYNDVFGYYIKNIYLDRFFTGDDLSEEAGCIVVNLSYEPKLYINLIRSIKSEERIIIFIPKDVSGIRYTANEYISNLLEAFQQSDKVKIVSGEHIVPYYNLFQSYYLGNVLKEEQAKSDVKVFCECIARTLNIKRRYNIMMDEDGKEYIYSKILKEYLPQYGVQYIELL